MGPIEQLGKALPGLEDPEGVDGGRRGRKQILYTMYGS